MKLSNELSISTLIEITRKVLHFNIFKAFYLRTVSLMNRLGAYGKRTNKYIDCFRPYVNNAKVIVDIGCGAGTFSKVIADGKRLIIALDIQIKLLRGIEGQNIEKICADAHHLPFREKSIDCALSTSLMEHLEDPERHVKELFTVLKPNGLFKNSLKGEIKTE